MLHKSIPAAWSPMPPARVAVATPDTRVVLLAAMDEADLQRYALPAFHRVASRTMAEMVAAIGRERPGAVVMDLDLAWVNLEAACRATAQVRAKVLAVTNRPEAAPRVLRAGCHGVLLKPFAPNLLAARLGRLVREGPVRQEHGDSRPQPRGTNRSWAGVSCPNCSAAGAWSFEFASHRRMWFACLGCDHVWIGARRE